MDKTQENLERWCSTEGLQFKDDEAEKKYRQKTRRIADVIQLKVPDRVPVVPSFGGFIAYNAGMTSEEVMFDGAKGQEAAIKMLNDYDPDTGMAGGLTLEMYEAIDYKALKLAGRGIPADAGMQYVEGEYATAEEFYDSFLFDPTDFILRKFLPRMVGLMEPLQALPPLNQVFSYYLGLPQLINTLAMPQIAGVFESISKAMMPVMQKSAGMFAAVNEVISLGYPMSMGGASHAPFDTIGDFIRGTKGIMLDMYRRPGKLLEVLEKMVPIHINSALSLPPGAPPFVFFPLHKGSDNFMSLDQFKTFYWPTLRRVMMAVIEAGFVPWMFWEGSTSNARLEIIADIPKGKAIYHFEKVDLQKAKEILGDTVCIKGNVPLSLLMAGTIEQVRQYVKELIDVAGKGGGLIVDSSAVVDKAKPENIKAMMDFAKEYGVYRM